MNRNCEYQVVLVKHGVEQVGPQFIYMAFKYAIAYGYVAAKYLCLCV